VHDNPHLHRAVLRSLKRPFSVLLTDLSSQLLPLLSSPAFYAVPTVSNQFPFPNAVQLHVLSFAQFCEEVIQVFDELGLGTDMDVRGDGLKSTRDGFVSIINRVVNPFIAGIRGELVPIIEALESTKFVTATKPTAAKTALIYHPSIVALQILMPVYTRALTTYTSSTLSHATLASLLISMLWKAMVALSHRVDTKMSPLLTPEASPMLSGKKNRVASTTPPLTPPPGRFMIKLPPSRPPSPPALAFPSVAADAKVLYDLLISLPRPTAAEGPTRLAKEAVDEAFEGLRTLPALLDAVKYKMEFSGNASITAQAINHLTTEIPSLIALPIVLHAFGGSSMSSVASMLGISEDEYRKGCLSGFSRAEECAIPVAQRVMEILQLDAPANEVVIKWLEIELLEMEEEMTS